MTEATIDLVNASERYHDAIEQLLEPLTAALNYQARQIANHWGEYIHHVHDGLQPSGWRMHFLDDADQAGALGYHDVDPDGRPYARVFVGTILDSGGTLADGPFS